MIPKDTIDKIFDSARIEEVVGDFVSLKKRGTNLLGLCPFHNEKTPSFNVSPVKGIYKCFGCGKAGNSVNFIMEHEQMTYPEALRYLAKKYQIEIEEQETTPEQLQANNDRESLLVVCSFAQKYFTENLLSTDEGKSIGLSYFKERGFRDDIIEKFQLGYSMDNRKAFSDTALKAGYKLEFLVKAGLTISKEDELTPSPSERPGDRAFDRFSGRVMFPIHNVTGRVIAFGGRILKTDKKMAKYINSPETEIYHKSKVLYGLFQAKKGIIQDDNCYLVEGYTDVISMHQVGIENVVASSGTSLTVEQIRLIKRYTPNITILYDGDAAGIKASFRGIDLILEEGMNVRVLLFPNGDDPDSYSKKVSNEEFKGFIKTNTKDFISFKTSLLFADVANDPIKKAGLIKDIVESIAVIPEEISRSVYVQECSRIMQIEEQVLLNELNKIRRNKFFDKAKKEETRIEVENALENVLASEKHSIPENTAEPQEKEIIRLLLTYGNKTIHLESEDEEGKPIEVAVSITEFITHDLSQDQIKFENHIYQSIFQAFVVGVENSAIPDEQFFIQNVDIEISQLAINLLSTPYSLHKWDNHNILVQTEEHILKVACMNSIYALKSKRVEKMLHENQQKLKDATTDEEIMQLQQYHSQLLNAKKEFNSILGRVIIK